MDLADTIATINIHKETPLNIENFAVIIDNHHTEFIICRFLNNITYIITQFGKVGNLYSVELEQVENSIVDNEPVYNLRTLLGGDSIEVEAGIRYIAERLAVNRSSLFSLTLKSYKVEYLKLVVAAIRNFK